MATKKKFFIDNDILRIILVVLGSVFSTLVLVFAVFAITEVQKNNIAGCPPYLLGIFIVLGLSRLITYIKERTKITLIRFLVLFTFDIAIGILIMFASDSPYLFSLSGGLYCLTVILSRVLIILQKPKVRTIVFNAIIVLLFAFLAIGLFIPSTNEEETAGGVILLLCLIIAISAFVEVVSAGSSSIKAKVLFKIIIRTFALEVILGLLTIMVAFSLAFMLYEPNITTFADAIWYSFAVVTTIGFGDFTAVTPIGRILTVILGMYGIIVVAVITSIIVNFYNETAGKHDSEEIKEIKKEENNNKK